MPLGSDFPLHNLPWGVFSVPGHHQGSDEEIQRKRIGVAIGESVVDVSALAARGLLSGRGGASSSSSSSSSLSSCLESGREGLNPFLALGKPAWSEARQALTSLLRSSEGVFRDDEGLRKSAVFDLREIKSHLPMRVGDYTDFYASKEHATNCGCLFRDPENALQPNWTSLPVGYHGEIFFRFSFNLFFFFSFLGATKYSFFREKKTHPQKNQKKTGRSSSIVVSGTDVRRPRGQLSRGVFGPSKAVDFELEVGAVLGGPSNRLGEAVDLAAAGDRIFGYCLLNDWSARDVQSWEMVPLGPFNGKNWATTVSAWIVSAEAVEPWVRFSFFIFFSFLHLFYCSRNSLFSLFRKYPQQQTRRGRAPSRKRTRGRCRTWTRRRRASGAGARSTSLSRSRSKRARAPPSLPLPPLPPLPPPPARAASCPAPTRGTSTGLSRR